MSASPSIASYKDIRTILDAILSRDSYPVQNIFETKGRALNWKQRANTFRLLDRKINAQVQGLPEHLGESPYDELVFQNPSATPNIIIIDKQGTSSTLVFPDSDSATNQSEAPDDDDLIKI